MNDVFRTPEHGDVLADGRTYRTHSGIYGRYNSGRSQIKVKVDCPFCDATTEAFLWSLAGGGKKCSCGAILYVNGGKKKI